MLHFRFAKAEDIDLFYEWVNDPLTRRNSFNTNEVLYDEHLKWFTGILISPDTYIYVFFTEDELPVGQVRVEKFPENNIISISIDKNHRSKSYGKEMLNLAVEDFFIKNPDDEILAYIKNDNHISLNIFSKAGFTDKHKAFYKECECFVLKRTKIK